MNKEEEAELKRKLDIMWRGMYGDEDNEIPGVVDIVGDLKKLADKLKKAIYVGIGIIGTLQALFWVVEKLHLV